MIRTFARQRNSKARRAPPTVVTTAAPTRSRAISPGISTARTGGIYFDGPAFWRHVRDTQAELGPGAAVPWAMVVRSVFEQVLAHERTQFAGDVLGTELEGRLARAGYRDYVLTGYSFRSPWTSGAPEEMLATHTEVNSAAAGALKNAAKAIASRAPAGYSEWALRETHGVAG